jgi:hypothetical protein
MMFKRKSELPCGLNPSNLPEAKLATVGPISINERKAGWYFQLPVIAHDEKIRRNLESRRERRCGGL